MASTTSKEQRTRTLPLGVISIIRILLGCYFCRSCYFSSYTSILYHHHHESQKIFAELRSSWGWKAPVETIQSNPPAQAGSSRGGCAEPFPVGFRMSPRRFHNLSDNVQSFTVKGHFLLFRWNVSVCAHGLLSWRNGFQWSFRSTVKTDWCSVCVSLGRKNCLFFLSMTSLLNFSGRLKPYSHD